MSDNLGDNTLAHVICGKWGSGKTYFGVTKMLAHLMTGGVVVSNVQLNWEACERYFKGYRVTVPRENYRHFDLVEVAENMDSIVALMTEGCMLVLDEVHLTLEARQFRENAKKADHLRFFMSQGRKFRCTVYLIAQADDRIDKTFREQAAYTHRLLNWKDFPFLGGWLPFPLTVDRVCRGSGNTQVGREWIWRSGAVYKCYDTLQKHMGLTLTGAKAKTVVGAKKARWSYGMRLICAGLACLGLDQYFKFRESRKPPPVSAFAPPAKPAPSHPAPASQLFVDPARSSLPALPPMSALHQVEAALPLVYASTAKFIHLRNGARLQLGTAFVGARVTAWEDFGDTVLVHTSSSAFPFVTLYKSDAIRCLQFDDSGRPLRLGGRSDPLGLVQSVGNSPGMVETVGPPSLPSVQLQQPGTLGASTATAYVAPPPFIPVDSGYRSALVGNVPHMSSESRTRPVQPSGFGIGNGPMQGQ